MPSALHYTMNSAHYRDTWECPLLPVFPFLHPRDGSFTHGLLVVLLSASTYSSTHKGQNCLHFCVKPTSPCEWWWSWNVFCFTLVSSIQLPLYLSLLCQWLTFLLLLIEPVVVFPQPSPTEIPFNQTLL